MGKKLFLIIGPSGSGKTTLGNYLKKIGVPELVSHTTREMREGEIDGVSYYFVDKDIIMDLEKIEYNEYAGNTYCISKKELEDKLKVHNMAFATVDINGYGQIKEKYGDIVVSIFLMVTMEEMIERMVKRGDNPENILKRLVHNAREQELDNWMFCDYTIRNDSLERAVETLKKIVETEKESLIS